MKVREGGRNITLHLNFYSVIIHAIESLNERFINYDVSSSIQKTMNSRN